MSQNPSDLLAEIRDELGELPQRIADVLREPVRQEMLAGGGGGPSAAVSRVPPQMPPRQGPVTALGAALGYGGLGIDQQLGLIRAGARPPAQAGRSAQPTAPPAAGRPTAVLQPTVLAAPPPAAPRPATAPAAPVLGRPTQLAPPVWGANPTVAVPQARPTALAVPGPPSSAAPPAPPSARPWPPAPASTARQNTTPPPSLPTPPPVPPFAGGALAGGSAAGGDLARLIEELTDELRQLREALTRGSGTGRSSLPPPAGGHPPQHAGWEGAPERPRSGPAPSIPAARPRR